MDEGAPDVGASQLMTAQPTTALSVGSRGTSQSGVGLYNERLILSLIRRQRSLAKVEIARLTGLSTQTTTVIINRLEAMDCCLPASRSAAASASHRCRMRSIRTAPSGSAS